MYRFTNTSPDFWIQTKGENAGKPLRKQIPNSIGIKVNPELLVPDFLFYIVLLNYQTSAFKPYLKGSVVPFIRIGDIRRIIDRQLVIFILSHQEQAQPVTDPEKFSIPVLDQSA